MEIDKETYDQIAELIHSDESPVGIDAKKTHILILHKLAEIEKSDFPPTPSPLCDWCGYKKKGHIA